jgi:molecular chaperone GrpE
LKWRQFSTESGDNKEGEKAEEKAKADDNAGEGAAEPEMEEPALAKLEAEVKDLKDKLIRSYAEEENVRRIARRDVDNAKAYANTSFAKALLEVADDLERALAAVPEEQRADPSVKTLYEGVQMTDKLLHKVFTQFGVVKYAEVGDKFDPNLHDALFNMPAAEPEKAGTVGSIVKKGYKLKDRVIRAAQVGAIPE